MIIDGKKIAEEIRESLKGKFSGLGFRPTVAIVQVGDDPVTSKFVRSKQKFAEEIGVNFEINRFPGDVETAAVLEKITELNDDTHVKGIVVQLPLPNHFDTKKVLDAVSISKDIDVLSSLNDNFLLTPIVGVVKEILERFSAEILPAGDAGRLSEVVVVGQGKLVGKPVAEWFKKQEANVTVLDKENWKADSSAEALAKADIIVTGAGSPGLVKPEMLASPKLGEGGIKSGVVLIDAGTSESAGKLVGDADPACAEKCSVFTPVPGGVGPMTVAMLFKNLWLLCNVPKK